MMRGFPLRVREPLLQWEHQLEDMVLDCSLLRCDDKSYIAVGYAHNCIDVYDLDALLTEEASSTSATGPTALTPLRCVCSSRCLF